MGRWTPSAVYSVGTETGENEVQVRRSRSLTNYTNSAPTRRRWAPMGVTHIYVSHAGEDAQLLPCWQSICEMLGEWKPVEAAVFHYDDENPRREENHRQMESDLRAASLKVTMLQFTEMDAAMSLRQNMQLLRGVLGRRNDSSIVLDISVFTKRHLLMMLRWLDDEGLWDRLTIVYSEPED